MLKRKLLVLILLITISLSVFAADTTAPSTNFTYSKNNLTDYNLSLTCSDSNIDGQATGCKYIGYSIDDGNWIMANVNKEIETTITAGWATDTYGVGLYSGIEIKTKHDLNLQAITVPAANDSTKCAVFDKTMTYEVGSTTTRNGNDFNFATAVHLTDANYYVLGCLKVGSPTIYTYVNFSFPTSKTLIDLNRSITWHGAGIIDGVSITQARTIEAMTFEGESNTYTFIYSGTGTHTIDFNSTDMNGNNEATKTSLFPIFTATTDPINSRILFYGVGQFNNYTVTSWTWLINSSLVGTDQNIIYYAPANQDLNTCLTTSNGVLSNTICELQITGDNITPTIDANVSILQGFVSSYAIDYNMRCFDNSTPVYYEVIKNDTNILYASWDANASIYAGQLSLQLFDSAAMTFRCTDFFGNYVQKSFPKIYAVRLNLVNERTGATITCLDINVNFKALKAYSFDGNYTKDYNVACASTTINYFGYAQNIIFDYQYNDDSLTQLIRNINFGLINHGDINVCAPFFQSFYEQQFSSNSQTEIQLYNNISKCYNLAAPLNYLSSSNYQLITYTTNQPYLLYTVKNNVKTLFAYLNGGLAQAYNLDIILYNRQTAAYQAGQDSISAYPLINPLTNKPDLNTLQIIYYSTGGNNTLTTIKIYDSANTELFSYADINTPNYLTVNWYYGDVNGLTDSNYLRLVVSVVNPISGNKVTTIYINTGAAETVTLLDPAFAVIMSALLFMGGMTIVSIGRAFGFFGILICLVSTAICAYANPLTYWWVGAAMMFYIVTIFFIIFSGKPQNSDAASWG